MRRFRTFSFSGSAMADSRLRQAVAPLYLLLCLLVGGSAQGVWGNMLLQLVGLAIIGWSILDRSARRPSKRARSLLWIATAAVLLVAVQLLPLPLDFWAKLGGRAGLAADYRLLGFAPGWLPASVTPYRSFETLLSLIPPAALFCAMVRLNAYRASWLCAALLGGPVAGIMLGALQVTSSDPLHSPWYLFPEVNFGVATGFFANANHMATLLVISLPFLAALAASARSGGKQLQSSMLLVAAVAALVVIVGVALNGSLAGYALVLPALAAAALILLPQGSRLKLWTGAAAGLLLVAALALIGTGQASRIAGNAGASESVGSRSEMLGVTSRAMAEFMPLGSGLGSFQPVYRMYEDAAAVTPTYVVHAHNDYAELALELGIGGIALMAAFLWWWGRAALGAWRGRVGSNQPFARAASVASAIILAHSLVDFPLRTAAISTCFAMCLALLAERRPPRRDASDLRPARHIVYP
jgi:O-antigen ligase